MSDRSPEAGTPASSPAVSRFVGDLETLIRARYPLIYLVTFEEQRVDAILQDLAAAQGKTLHGWSITRGLRTLGRSRTLASGEGTKDPSEALAAIEKLSEPSLVVLKDFHPFLNDPTVVRALRELAHHLKSTFTTLILVSPTLHIPVELEKEISVLDVPLPTAADLLQLLREIVHAVKQGSRVTIDLNRADAEQLVRAALGLTITEAENAFAKAIARDQRLDASDVGLILEEKRQVIRKSGLLEYTPMETTLAGVGGLELLKAWLGSRAGAFGEAARQFGLPEPRGLLLLGVQGCGKTLTAKAIAAEWQLPLLRLDMGRIFSSLVGSSEENVRRAIRTAESVAPVVLWVDEIDKGLAGLGSSGATDSGVTARVFGSFLTWLQEKASAVFVVATANRIDMLPPELLRKGRFDEIFFIDLPSSTERKTIFEIHLAKRRRDPHKFDLVELTRLADGFSGAEIEQAVVSALFTAFAEKTDLTQAHVARALEETCPIAVTMKEEIGRLREWARERTRPASPSPVVPSAPIATRFGG